MDYTQHFSTKKTTQTQPIPGRAQVKNSAGGFSFQIDGFKQLDRFLILGTQGGTYYAKESELTVENANAVIALIKIDGLKVLKRTVEVSVNGLAPKNNAAIFTMALLCTFGDEETKKATYQNITKVCRNGTNIFMFTENIQKLRGWSRGLRNGVAKFYEQRTPGALALQLIKYRQRNGWTHKDVIRLAHPTFSKECQSLAYHTLGKKLPEGLAKNEIWMAFEKMQTCKDKELLPDAIELIQKYELPWEALPTELLNFRETWEALLPHMGHTALLRNLSRFAKLGMTTTHSFDETTKAIIKKFSELEEGGLHPINILNGNLAYLKGHSSHSGDKWQPSMKLVDALDKAFYTAFKTVEPTNKNYMLCLDVSGSMSSPELAGTALTPRVASTALALVTMNTEPETFLMGFSNRFMELKISKSDRLQNACQYTAQLPFESTDCAIPMLYATKNKIPVDVFAVYTDSETYMGSAHPTQALEQYRQTMGRDAKLVVVGMTSNGFTIADPKDPRQLDVVGFSLDTPQAISAFARD